MDDTTRSGLSRRRILAGSAAALGAAALARGLGRVGAAPAELVQATATRQAVRLDPPDPYDGFVTDTLYVALYGHPGSRTLGALGEQGVAAAIDRVRAVAAPYVRFGRRVVPTFEIIATVASAFAGSDGDYSNEFPASKFLPWIDAAEAAGVHVVLDLQSGRSSFPSQAREIEPLLARRHVGLAVDPEWRVGPTQTPGGGRIGTVDGAEIQQTVAWLDDLIRRRSLPRKMLIVHQFTPSMVTNKQLVRSTPDVQVVFHMDGFGSLELKRASWNRMIADLPPTAATGWKNFYDEDRPTPTPEQTLAVAPTPIVVSYQ